ncbi:alpha/beta hydrolase [Caulobacter sp. BE254]|uniref:alpha/beta hydrolase n=1 Tax=Caulobacter sp. BE254 TaxID=2817720 RepID=UPI00285E33DD|nr:alpha/beta hydrolase [Caulobacter sp. BE254]MDR7114269.1 pimeloyl-ACP methyl ester carboxylesterase [Caulobacter sp. BE254]
MTMTSWATGWKAAFVLACTAAIGWSQAAVAAPKAGEIVMERGVTTTGDGRSIAYEIGTLYAPENRAASGGRIIGVGFARLKAAHPTGAPPIFILPGGPGRSYLNAFTDTDEAGRSRLAEVLAYTEAADVVVVDQRGWSRRGDVLELSAPDQPLDRPRTLAADAADMNALARAAVAANSGKDLAGYTIVQCAEDVNDLRRALGYERIALSGQSFGSQWSFAVMRLHPDVVARAVLSGGEPLDDAFDMPSQILASLQRVAFEAEQDPGLKPYLPAGGLMGAVRTVHSGRYDDWARETIERRRNAEGAVRLIEPLIDSSLGVSAARGHRLRTDPAADILGFWDFDAVTATAADWPTPDLDDAFRLPVVNPTPVVFIHGDWDISTPIDNTLGVLPYFPNGHAILVHRGTHHTREPLLAGQPELRTRLMAFLRTGDAAGLPVEAALPAQAFTRPSFPPPTRSSP